MQWYVAKTGFEMLDAFHAYGLSLLLAAASSMPIHLRDDGPMYHLSSAWTVLVPSSLEVFDALLTLPTAEEVLKDSIDQGKVAVSVATLDGLFALLFTKGERIHSVHDLLGKRRFDPDAVEKGLKKATEAVKEWREYIQRQVPRASDWLTDLLRDYASSSLALPLPRTLRRGKDLTVMMTLDPAFGYSTRRPLSDGLVDRKVNVALQGARYATLLAYLGAARFLRAQRVAGNLVNLYVPLASDITIRANTALAPLRTVDRSPQHALVYQQLSLLHTRHILAESQNVIRRCVAPAVLPDLWMEHSRTEVVWKGLAYQTLQTQGIQQSLSVDRGCLECPWIVELEQQAKISMTRFWRFWLGTQSETSVDEQERLVESLICRRPEVWQCHLCDIARHAFTKEVRHIRRYSVEEVKSMRETASTPLHTILEREEGTLRFGRALHQLGRFNPSALNDLLDPLETVQTFEQLMRVLHRAMQECVLAKAQYRYIRIPTNRDLAVLITDVDQYGVRRMASILMILSALRFYQREIDKYEVYSLITALLLLVTQASTGDDPSGLSSESVADIPADMATFSFDEGEPDV